MEQQGSKWHEWRKQGIGGSDVAAVLGISPYKTALQLYDEKVSAEHKDISNHIMELGKRTEPKARAMFELMIGKEFPAALVQMEEYTFMRASLDGRSNNALVEFKYTGKQKPIPPHYMAQMQHQMLCSGAVICYYQSYDVIEPNEAVLLNKHVIVEADKIYQERILKACIEFWDCVTKRKPPEPSERDYVAIKDKLLPEKLIKWRRLKMERDGIQLKIDEIENYAKALVTEKRMYCGNVKFVRVTRPGSINYKAIPELANINLEPFRGKPTEFVTIKGE